MHEIRKVYTEDRGEEKKVLVKKERMSIYEHTYRAIVLE